MSSLVRVADSKGRIALPGFAHATVIVFPCSGRQSATSLSADQNRNSHVSTVAPCLSWSPISLHEDRVSKDLDVHFVANPLE